VQGGDWETEAKGELREVYRDGVLVKEFTLKDIRRRCMESIAK